MLMRSLYKTEESVNGLRRLSHRYISVMHVMLPLSDPLDESPPRSPPESFSPTDSACLPSPPGDPYFDTPQIDTPEINVSPLSVQCPKPTRIRWMEKIGLSARATAATQALLLLLFPLRSGMEIPMHALNRVRLGSGVQRPVNTLKVTGLGYSSLSQI